MLMDQASLRILAGQIQVPPGVVPSFPVAVKKDPTIEHFHNEKLTADPYPVTALPSQHPKAHSFRGPKALQYLSK